MADLRPTQKPKLLDGLKGFSKNKLNKVETRVTHIRVVRDGKGEGKPKGAETALDEEEIKEFFESPEVLKGKAEELAKLMKGKKTVIYTGAGISTSAKIPDYRGPKGIWTLAAKGERVAKSLSLESALPTFTHMAIKTLVDEGLCSMVVSTNVDGLHMRSGLTAKHLQELHGNIYKEVCGNCQTAYLRPSDVTKNSRQRFTGRLCERKGCEKIRLRDSIINFGENLPQHELETAEKASSEADVALVLGSSMRVQPACLLPRRCYEKPEGSLAILNLQKTPFDKDCTVRIFGKCDEFMGMLMECLGLGVPAFDESAYIAGVRKQMQTIREDPNFLELEKYEGLNALCGEAQHKELLKKVKKVD